MEIKSQALQIVDYTAPSVEYAAVASAKKRKATSPDSGDDEQSTGRVQLCVKSKPWDLTLGSSSLAAVDFRKARISASLVDHETQEVVELRNAESLGFTLRPSANGKQCAVEVRIGVLSSQMEGALFAIRFTAESRGESLSVLSEPIRVVSKKSQLEKANPKRTRTSQVATRDAVLDLINKIESQNVPSLMGKLFVQNEAILAQLGKTQKRGSTYVEEEEDSSVCLQARTSPLVALLDMIKSDRSAIFTELNALSESDKRLFADMSVALAPPLPSGLFSPPPPAHDMPFPVELRMRSSDRLMVANIFDL